MAEQKGWRQRIWDPPKYYGYKISAVLLALMLWIFVTVPQPSAEQLYTVPIEMRNLNSELTLTETNYQAQVRVSGSAASIAALSSRYIAAYVDFTDVMAGEATLEVQLEPLPDNVQLISVSPTSITVTLEEVASRDYTVEPRISGQPDENSTILDPVITPSLVTVGGAEEYLSIIGSVFVHADIGGITTNYNQNLAVEIEDTEGNDITQHFVISPSSVQVMIPVIYAQPEKALAVSVPLTGETAEGYQVSRVVVEPATVRAFGAVAALNALYYLETEPVDISGLSANHTVTVRVLPPAGIEVDTATVTVVVQVQATATQEYSSVIELLNADETLSYNLSDSQCVITVSGPAEEIAALNEDDIRVYVDVAGLGEGEHLLTVEATTSGNIELQLAVPAQVTLLIEQQPAGE
ncbi:MAG: CdaR family protein [Bacillota bacterium]|nr:CdaR family protein [Bacillota bacterium]